MKQVAVILSGSGVFDGAELHEAVLTLLAIEQEGASYQCFAPDVNQLHVVNHLTGEVSEGETRNVLVESARIARGDIKPVTECQDGPMTKLPLELPNLCRGSKLSLQRKTFPRHYGSEQPDGETSNFSLSLKLGSDCITSPSYSPRLLSTLLDNRA